MDGQLRFTARRDVVDGENIAVLQKRDLQAPRIHRDHQILDTFGSHGIFQSQRQGKFLPGYHCLWNGHALGNVYHRLGSGFFRLCDRRLCLRRNI